MGPTDVVYSMRGLNVTDGLSEGQNPTEMGQGHVAPSAPPFRSSPAAVFLYWVPLHLRAVGLRELSSWGTRTQEPQGYLLFQEAPSS